MKLDISRIEQALSTDRFQAYVHWANGDRERALELYRHNTQVATTFYHPLQTLEVCLRNGIHTQLSRTYGERWYDNYSVVRMADQQSKIERAKSDLANEGKVETPGRIVASLMFGFWTACFNERNQESMWIKAHLSSVFKYDGKGFQRKDANRHITPLRHLRNRVAHHEPILYMPLDEHYSTICMLIRRMNPDIARWAEQDYRFESVYDPGLASMASQSRP